MGSLSADELAQFADTTRRFVAGHYTPKQWRAFVAEEGHSCAMWKRYAELGWLGLPVAEAYGGAGGGAVELGVLLETSGRGLLLEPLLPTLAIGAGLILALGDEAQRHAILPAVAAGGMTLAFAHAEPGSGHERLLVTATADDRDGASRISGEKRFVLQATGAARLIVSARAPDGSLGLYLVAPDAPGLSLRPYRTLDGRSVADIRLDSVPGERLGTEDASAALERVLDLAATALCAESMAIIAELNAATLEYARTRRQFGHAIGTFQVIQHRLVDMMTAEQEGWAVTRCAQRALDDGVADAWRIVSVAKARVDHTARFVGEQAIQLHGGLGITDELMIGHQVKRLILNTTLLGDAQWHLDRLGRDL